MASGALLRRRKLISDHLTVSARCFLGVRNVAQGHYTDQLLESRAFSTFTHIPSQEKDSKKNDDVTLFVNGDLLKTSALGLFRTSCYGNGKPDLGFIMGPRQTSQFVRYASTATAGQPNLDGDEERNEELVAKKRKEASAEDFDQVVEGLSTAKSKAKAKRLQESHNFAITILRKVWTTILGIGPALRAVASMSREDWAKKLVYWKNEFVSTLQHYWLGIKLLGADDKMKEQACDMVLEAENAQIKEESEEAVKEVIVFQKNQDETPDFPLDILLEETFDFSKLKKDSYFKKMKNMVRLYPPFEDEEDVGVMYIWRECRSVDDYQRIKLIASDGSVVHPIYRRCDFYSVAVWTRRGLDVFENKMLSGIDYSADLNIKILNIGLSYHDLAGKEQLNYSLSSMDSAIKVISHGYEVEKHKEYCRAVAVLLGPIPEASKLVPVRDFIGIAFDVGWDDSEHFMSAIVRRHINLWAKLSWRIRKRRGSSEKPFFVYRFRDGGDLVEEEIESYKEALKTISLLHVPRNKQPGQQPITFQCSLEVIGRRLLFSRDNQILRVALERYCQETLNDAERDTQSRQC